MNLSAQQINAVVATLEKQHNEKYNKQDEMDQKALEKKFKSIAQKARKELVALSKDTKTLLNSSDVFYQGTVMSEKVILECFIEEYQEELENKKRTKSGLNIFNRDEIKRQVVMASIESKDVAEILKKIGKK